MYVTKQPLSEPYYSAEVSAGSFNFYRGAVDLTGSLTPNKTVLYRLNVAAQTTEGSLDFYDEQQYFLAPVLSWQISDRTKITFSGEYQVRPKKDGQQGLPAEGTVLPNPNGKIPRDRNISEPFGTIDQSTLRVGYDLEILSLVQAIAVHTSMIFGGAITFSKNDTNSSLDYTKSMSITRHQRIISYRYYDIKIEQHEVFYFALMSPHFH